MKAYKDKDGEVYLSVLRKISKRINKSAKRLATPEITEEMFIRWFKALVDMDRNWIPYEKENHILDL